MGTYGIQIGGTVDDEAGLIDKVNALTSDPANGVSFATGSFGTTGAVTFTLPTPSPDVVAADLDAAKAAVAAIGNQPTADEVNAAYTALAKLATDAGLQLPAGGVVAVPPATDPSGTPVAAPVGGTGDPNTPPAAQAVQATADAATAAPAPFALPDEAPAAEPVPTATPA